MVIDLDRGRVRVVPREESTACPSRVRSYLIRIVSVWSTDCVRALPGPKWKASTILHASHVRLALTTKTQRHVPYCCSGGDVSSGTIDHGLQEARANACFIP